MLDKDVLNYFSCQAQSNSLVELKKCLNEFTDYLIYNGYSRIRYGNSGLTTVNNIKNNFVFLESNLAYYKYMLRMFLDRVRLEEGYTSAYLYSIDDDKCQCSRRTKREFPDMIENEVFSKLIFVK